MKKTKPRVPTKIKDAILYIDTTDDILQAAAVPPAVTAGVRLGLVPIVTTEWHTRRQKVDVCYALASKVATGTPLAKKNLRQELAAFRKYAIKPLNVIASSPNATNDDAASFNVVINRANPTHSITPIAALCYAKVITMGGEKMKSKCYTASDGKRASLADGADGVEMVYKVGGDDEAPKSPKDCTESFTSSKAIFEVTCAGGRKLNLFSYHRWYNSKHPELSGVFGELKTNLIV